MVEKVKDRGEECREVCYNEYWVDLEQEVVDPEAEKKYQQCVKQCDIKPGA